MRSFHFLVNPAAGGGAAPAAVVPVARALRDAGARVAVTYSPGPDQAHRLVSAAIEADEVVVAVGGDGMLASLATQVVDEGGTLGIVPAGRGNDFARQLGIGPDPVASAARLLEAAPSRVDAIEVVCGARRRVVLGSVYAGVDAHASEIVERATWLPRRLQYPYAAVRALAAYHPAHYTVSVDGETREHDAATVVVANSGYYGSGMHIAPAASPTDGILDVVVIAAASKRELIRSLPKVYDGSHVDLDEVTVVRGREVAVSADGPVAAYADGEPLGALSVTCRVLPGVLSVLR